EAIYGNRPKALRVFFPHDDPAIFFPQDLKAYGRSSGLYCRGDGETAKRVRTKKETVQIEGKPKEIKVPVMAHGRPILDEIPCVPDKSNPEGCPIWAAGHCRRVATLIFSLADFRPFTYWVIQTGSWNSIVNINSGVDSIRQIMGGIAGLSLRLVLKPQKTRDPDSGKMRHVHVLSLETMTESERKLLIPPEQVFGLPAPPTEKPDDLFPATPPDIDEPRTKSGQLVPVPDSDGILDSLAERARGLGVQREEWEEMVKASGGNLIALAQALDGRAGDDQG
ncbi:MAG: hypothetical protein GWO44_18250, partial [Thermoplasmata archaeon]|nr:hypothetical protein [Thermoplasmata archaeon]NIY05141.1 hypothetical protein [Thermoplasmata archaeon]